MPHRVMHPKAHYNGIQKKKKKATHLEKNASASENDLGWGEDLQNLHQREITGGWAVIPKQHLG